VSHCHTTFTGRNEYMEDMFNESKNRYLVKKLLIYVCRESAIDARSSTSCQDNTACEGVSCFHLIRYCSAWEVKCGQPLELSGASEEGQGHLPLLRQCDGRISHQPVHFD